jgi:GntR family transcriptional regulator
LIVAIVFSTRLLDDTNTNGIILGMEVNRNDSVALHVQVAAEIRRAIADGEAAPGERLPPATDLADVLGVNKNTVMRALHLLRDEGLLDFTRGRGVRVVGTPQQSAVLVRIIELLAFAREQGYRRDEVVAIIESQGLR